MSRKEIGVGVMAALIALSQGTCYFPNCPRKVVVISEGIPSFDLQRAHIFPATWGGPREDYKYPIEKRDNFENLILLCKPHHGRVDADAEKYSAPVLMGWKSDREAPGLMTLESLGGLTEDRLQEMLRTAAESQIDGIQAAIDRLQEVDLESAQVLRNLIQNMDTYQLAGYNLNEDSVTSLSLAARRLEENFHEDNIGSFAVAVSQLDEISRSGIVEELSKAARRLGNIDI